MNQNLINLGQKLTNLINSQLQEQITKEDYIRLLEKLEFMITKELKSVNGEIVEN